MGEAAAQPTERANGKKPPLTRWRGSSPKGRAFAVFAPRVYLLFLTGTAFFATTAKHGTLFQDIPHIINLSFLE